MLPEPIADNLIVLRRWNAVRYPVDISRLLTLLPEKGWIVSSQQVVEGSTVPLPQKGNSTLRFFGDANVLGVSSDSPESVLQDFEEAISLVESLGGEVNQAEHYYSELRYIGKASGAKNPTEALKSYNQGNIRSAKLSEVLQASFPFAEKLSGFGARLGIAGSGPGSTTWAEINVLPSDLCADQEYTVEITYRSKDEERVKEIARQLYMIVQTAINEIENA